MIIFSTDDESFATLIEQLKNNLIKGILYVGEISTQQQEELVSALKENVSLSVLCLFGSSQKKAPYLRHTMVPWASEIGSSFDGDPSESFSLYLRGHEQRETTNGFELIQNVKLRAFFNRNRNARQTNTKYVYYGTALFDAMIDKNHVQMERLLQQDGVDPNLALYKDENPGSGIGDFSEDITPIYFAVSCQDIIATALLLKFGARFNGLQRKVLIDGDNAFVSLFAKAGCFDHTDFLFIENHDQDMLEAMKPLLEKLTFPLVVADGYDDSNASDRIDLDKIKSYLPNAKFCYAEFEGMMESYSNEEKELLHAVSQFQYCRLNDNTPRRKIFYQLMLLSAPDQCPPSLRQLSAWALTKTKPYSNEIRMSSEYGDDITIYNCFDKFLAAQFPLRELIQTQNSILGSPAEPSRNLTFK